MQAAQIQAAQVQAAAVWGHRRVQAPVPLLVLSLPPFLWRCVRSCIHAWSCAAGWGALVWVGRRPLFWACKCRASLAACSLLVYVLVCGCARMPDLSINPWLDFRCCASHLHRRSARVCGLTHATTRHTTNVPEQAQSLSPSRAWCINKTLACIAEHHASRRTAARSVRVWLSLQMVHHHTCVPLRACAPLAGSTARGVWSPQWPWKVCITACSFVVPYGSIYRSMFTISYVRYVSARL